MSRICKGSKYLFVIRKGSNLSLILIPEVSARTFPWSFYRSAGTMLLRRLFFFSLKAETDRLSLPSLTFRTTDFFLLWGTVCFKFPLFSKRKAPLLSCEVSGLVISIPSVSKQMSHSS